MVSVLILGFIAGALLANGVPSFTRGIAGKKHPTPFGKPSSATENVVWGWLNWVGAVIVWHVAPMHLHPRAAFVAVAAGVLFVGIMLADNGSRHPEHS